MAPVQNDNGTTYGKKKLILNAFDMGCSGLQAPGLWKHPNDQSRNYNKLDYWVNLAKLLEKGKFNALFLADVLGPYDVYNGPRNYAPAAKSGAQFPVNEPSAAISAMAAVTKNLSFGVTFSTISEAPYHLARRLATLDHLTQGRIGWNVVSSYLDSASRNLLNGENLLPHDERYDQAEEFIEVIYKLFLSSWSDDAVELKNGVFSNPDKIREINHKGKYYTVPGPNITEPTPQRLPVILQAGTSSKGKDFAAKNAEIVFITTFSPKELGKQIKDIKKLAFEKYNRPKGSIKFLQLITPIIGDTHEEAKAKYLEFQKYGDLEGAQALFGGWTGVDIGKYKYDEDIQESGTNAVRSFLKLWNKGIDEDEENQKEGDVKSKFDGTKKTREYIAKQITVGGLGPVFYGTAKEVADEIERWVSISDVDGFNMTYAITPGTFEDAVNYLVPELQKRGLVWNDYPKSTNENTNNKLTFREQLFGDINKEEPQYLLKSHPAYNLRWRKGETKEEFEKRINFKGTDDKKENKENKKRKLK
ncbi:unnamed protein product [Candida verbasci]|uniref:Luciferase-like domain-containing protein n=1 Tax=Candida verbasci TaxID=1227364 RepID=A0A9W4TYB5_9ASCO|nr:unnamed protein product [Candida verbasci]